VLPLKIPGKGAALTKPANFSAGLRAACGGWPMDAPAGAMKKVGSKLSIAFFHKKRNLFFIYCNLAINFVSW